MSKNKNMKDNKLVNKVKLETRYRIGAPQARFAFPADDTKVCGTLLDGSRWQRCSR